MWSAAVSYTHLDVYKRQEFPMTFTDKGNGHKVTVDADESFTNGVLWQQDAENFVCMEPWNG